MEPTEFDALTAEQDGDSDTIKQMRSALKEQSKALKEAQRVAEEAAKEAQGLRTAAMFDEVGVPKDGPGKLLRQVLSAEEDLTPERIREAALDAQIITGPTPEAGPGEMESHQRIAEASGTAPSPPPGLEQLIAAAQTPEEVLRLAESGGLPPVSY